MTKIKYTKEQIVELKNNKYVKSCSEKYISLTKECKLKSIELQNKGLTTREVFSKLGFPEYIIQSQIPFQSLNRWNKNINKKGVVDSKKGRKKTEYNPSKMTKDEYIEYLEMKLAIVEELKKIDSGDYP